MTRLLRRSIICILGACTLTACGGEGINDTARQSASLVSLNGNWFSERQGAQGPVYTSEMLVSETGDRVVFTYCNRMTVSLTRVGSQLFDREGRLHYLYVQNATTLASRPELNLNTILRKRSTEGRFNAGSVDVTLPFEKFSATTDVCAEVGPGRYGDTLGNEIQPVVVTISMPYRDSFIRITVAFREIRNGQYQVIEHQPFVRGGSNDVTISDFDSPRLETPDGGQAVVITSGTLQVSNYTGSSATLFADVKTTTGLPVTFTANVKLPSR